MYRGVQSALSSSGPSSIIVLFHPRESREAQHIHSADDYQIRQGQGQVSHFQFDKLYRVHRRFSLRATKYNTLSHFFRPPAPAALPPHPLPLTALLLSHSRLLRPSLRGAPSYLFRTSRGRSRPPRSRSLRSRLSRSRFSRSLPSRLSRLSRSSCFLWLELSRPSQPSRELSRVLSRVLSRECSRELSRGASRGASRTAGASRGRPRSSLGRGRLLNSSSPVAHGGVDGEV